MYKVVKMLREAGIHNLTVQLEKEAYYQHMSGLTGATFQQMFKDAQIVHKLADKNSTIIELVKDVWWYLILDTYKTKICILFILL